jgi:RNA polymerase primary sigma factor
MLAVETLVERAQAGDRAARDRLVLEQMGLVHDIARRYAGLGLPIDDLVQEGAIGALAAIETFDPARGPFDRYVRFRVRSSIRDALTESSRIVRLPKRVVERRRAIDRYIAQRIAATGHAPSCQEIASALGLSTEAVIVARDAPTTTQLVEDGVAGELPSPAAVTQLEQKESAERIQGALDALPERQHELLARHFGIDAPAEELAAIAESLHVSRQRARAIEQDALYRLRDVLGSPA